MPSGRTEDGVAERLGWWLSVAALGDAVPLSAVLTSAGWNRFQCASSKTRL